MNKARKESLKQLKEFLENYDYQREEQPEKLGIILNTQNQLIYSFDNINVGMFELQLLDENNNLGYKLSIHVNGVVVWNSNIEKENFEIKVINNDIFIINKEVICLPFDYLCKSAVAQYPSSALKNAMDAEKEMDDVDDLIFDKETLEPMVLYVQKYDVRLDVVYSLYYLLCFPIFLNVERQGIACMLVWLAFEYISEHKFIVREENEKLKQQIDELTVENTLLQQDKYELNNLRQLFDLNDEYSQYEKTGARIIARDAGNWFHSFVINKGTEDGLQLDYNVIADGGLVGRIVDIGPNWAKVSSIINYNVNTSGETLSTSDNLIVSGDLELMGEGMIRFQNLVDSADQVVVGDKVVTSNISDKYLPGILIGYISSINTDSNNLTKSGTLTPAVDFEHLEDVLVILELKQTVEE